jgi:hypothetical protein
MHYCMGRKRSTSEDRRANGTVRCPLDARTWSERHVATPWIASPASWALLARSSVSQNHRIARLEVLNVLADRFNDARAFVPKHDREGHAVPVKGLYGEVGVAHAAVLDLNPNLIGGRWID